MVSHNFGHLYAKFLELRLMTVYQQSSQVEAWFSTADYSWLLLMTSGVIMVLLQHLNFFPFVLFCFVVVC